MKGARTSISWTYKENAVNEEFVIITFKNYYNKILTILSRVLIYITFIIVICFKIKSFQVQ